MLRELFAEAHALKDSVGVCRGRVELELRFVLLPEVLASLLGGGVFRLGSVRSGCCFLGGIGILGFGQLSLGILCGGLFFLLELRQTAQGLHMGAVEVQHVGLEAGDLETNAVILTLFGQLFVVGLADDLVGAVAGLLQQLVGIPDDVVAAQICTVQDGWPRG